MPPERSDVRRGDAETLAELLLDRDVGLIAERPHEVERRTKDLRRQRKARRAGRVIERKRTDASRQIAVRIRQREDGRERLPDGERLVVGRRVPLVARDAAV